MLVVSRYLWALLGVRRLGKIKIMIMAMSMREFDLLFAYLLLDNNNNIISLYIQLLSESHELICLVTHSPSDSDPAG